MAETSNKLQAADKDAKEAGTKQHDSTSSSGKHVVWGIGAVFLMVVATFGLQSIPQTHSGSRSTNSSFTLSIAPGGRSDMIRIPPGKRMTITGGPHQLVNVFPDGRECLQNCDGAIWNYVRNRENAWNTLSYRFID